MRITKLLSATAMTLALASVAHADDNATYIAQDGNLNIATIDQNDGTGNFAGTNATTLGMKQVSASNSGNTLTITQTGNDNTVGDTLVVNRGASVFQLGQGANSGNTATITQSTSDNTIGSINQKAGFGSGAGNTLTITQGGGDNNTITKTSQDRNNKDALGAQSGNTATVTQTGADNTVALVSQNGAGNSIVASFIGDRNGVAPLGGLLGDGVAAVTGVTSSELQQVGKSNSMTLNVDTANDTSFGIYQNGTSNTVGTLTISGDRNELGIYQNGDINVVTMGAIMGDDNEVGVSQVGTNRLDLNIVGMTSNRNIVSIDQDGTNIATVDVDGSDNRFSLGQDGTNTATINITGDRNGEATATNVFGGTAATLATDLGMTAGTITQNGASNTLNLTIEGDDNLFALEQSGGLGGNTLTGTVDGNFNQAVIAQIGADNTATFSQTGSTNTATVYQ